MMGYGGSYGTMQAVNDDACHRAAAEQREPYVPYNVEELDSFPPYPFPNLGSYVPKNWHLVIGALFHCPPLASRLDEVGNETTYYREFRVRLADYVMRNPGHGLAIVEVNDSGVTVRAYRKANPVEDIFDSNFHGGA